MRFEPLEIAGAWRLELERIEDERGYFARSFCREELHAHGLETTVAQCSLSFNLRRRTLRGMHFQVAPHQEVKIVRCVRGAAYDVILDLRPDSSTYLKWTAVDLTAENGVAVYIPPGCAHGYQTLQDSTELLYIMNTEYTPTAARRARWNDPRFDICWPLPDPILSEYDAGAPDYLG